MNCTQCGNTGLVPVEKEGLAGVTYTVLARCKCQTDVITIPRAQCAALIAAAKALTKIIHPESDPFHAEAHAALRGLSAAGIQME